MPNACLVFSLLKGHNSNMTSTAPSFFLPFVIFHHEVYAEVQFTTHLSDSLNNPVFRKGAAFVFQFQAVTPESDSNVRVFSSFPQILDINLTNAYTILQQRGTPVPSQE